MKRRVYLLRHGKSDWGAGAQDDHERPLNARGQRAARRVGRVLAGEHAPDLVLSSSAVRARTTAELAALEGGWSAPVRLERRLYLPHPNEVLAVIREQGAGHASVLVAGHEPATSELCSLLCGGGRFHFPTAALARIDCDLDDWSALAPGVGTLVWLLPPKALES